jgi:hypothetical protein
MIELSKSKKRRACCTGTFIGRAELWTLIDVSAPSRYIVRIPMRYKLGCDLSYEVKKPTTFIFNFEVAKLQRHHDLIDTLTITPDVQRRTYVVPDIRNRYVSVTLSPGRCRSITRRRLRWRTSGRTDCGEGRS